MKQSEFFQLDQGEFNANPFPHFYSLDVLPVALEGLLIDWLEKYDSWQLTEADFYTQYEFSFEDVLVPSNLDLIVGKPTINYLENKFREIFKLDRIKLVSITAHKLIHSHKVSVHNDYIDGEETHRLVLQINKNWNQENGGFLMLFNSFNANDVATIYQPISNTAVGFEISSKSYHAVSAVNNFSRYSLVYTFKGQ